MEFGPFCTVGRLLPVYKASTQFIVRSDIIISIPVVSLVPFPLNPNWSSCTPSVFLSVALLSNLLTAFAVCMMRLIVRWLLCFVAFGVFKATVVTSSKSLGHSRFIHVGDQLCGLVCNPPDVPSASPDTSSCRVAYIFLISLTAFSTLPY